MKLFKRDQQVMILTSIAKVRISKDTPLIKRIKIDRLMELFKKKRKLKEE